MFSATKSSGPSGYNLTRSLRFRSSASAYLSRTPASASNRTTWTWSGWVKRGAISSATMGIFGVDGSTSYMFMIFNNSGSNNELDCGEVATTQQWRRVTTQVFRDPSAWYHLVLAFDSTQATAANRVKIYVNGTQVTSFSTSVDPSLNYSSIVNTATAHSIGRVALPTGFYLDGYFTEVNFIDGQALTPSSFGSTNNTTGVWQPARYTGTYGTNGFYLPFTDNSALTTASNAGLGKDFSGNANYWVTNNISLTAGSTYDSMTDVPTLTSATAANYAVLNAVSTGMTMADGNLKWTGSGSTPRNVLSSIAITTGKYYWEFTTVNSTGGGGNLGCGVSNNLTMVATVEPGNNTYGWELVTSGSSSNIYKNNNTSFTVISTYTGGDIWGIAIDIDAGKMWFSKNNTWIAGGNPASGTTPDFTGITGPVIPYGYGYNTGDVGIINFGQRPFTYTPPSGFVALNTYNLPASTVPNGAAYMAATTYTGNGGTLAVANTVGSTSFQPDWVWVKSRSTTQNNYSIDSVRGINNILVQNNTNDEAYYDATWRGLYGNLSAINSNGFTVVDGTDPTFDSFNGSGVTYIGWQWKGGGTAVSNTNGSITSSVSANTTSGCSVVTYTGVGGSGTTTVGHGLGVSPSMVIIKRRNSTANWATYHTGLTSTSYYLFLNSTDGQANYGSTFISPSSSTLTIDAGSSLLNTNTGTYVAYCFAAIKGFSAFGSYTGNGSTDGPFVYLGFRPRYLMLKVSSTAGYDWLIYDSSRDTYNVTQNNLRADTVDTESTQSANYLDFLSNGFKIRGSSAGSINPSQTVIYAAFAENPFQNSLAR